MITVWALDDGYGDNKGYTGNSLRSPLLLPSFCTNWRPVQQSELNESTIDLESHIGCEVDGRKYLVGKGALEQDTRLSWMGGENKHQDKNFPILLKACLGLMAEDQNGIIVDPLMMGLPVKAEENEDRHELLRKLVEGEHNVRITLADGTTFEKNIFINNVIAKKQPFGTFCDIILDKHGEIIRKDIAKGFNVIVDIGSRTLNIYTLDALDPVYDLCDTTNDGIYTAYDQVGNFIKERLGVSVPQGKLPDIIRRKEIRGIDLSLAIQKSYEILANNITNIIKTKFIDSWAFVSRLIFTGGGATLLKPYLSQSFGKEVHFMDRFSNVKGLFKYGIRTVKKAGKQVILLPNGTVRVESKKVAS